MQIMPISNYNPKSQNNSFKGCVSRNIKNHLSSYAPDFMNRAEKTDATKYPLIQLTLTAMAGIAMKQADIIISNMELLMSRFGKSCVLNWHQNSEKPQEKLFVIESKNSDYKYLLGKVNLNSNENDLDTIDEFVMKKLTKVNPYEANAKFKIMSKPQAEDDFVAEKEMLFVDDKLINAKEELAKYSVPVSDEYLAAAAKEVEEYKRESLDNGNKKVKK